MCLVINCSKSLLVLKGNLIAYKEFLFNVDNTVRLMPVFMDYYEYDFRKEGDFLIVKENDQSQVVNFMISTILSDGKKGAVVVSKSYNLGYHAYLFDIMDSFEEVFQINKNKVILPIVVDYIQLVSDNELVAKVFKILNSQKYIDLCYDYNIAVNKRIVDFLDALFETHCG